MPRAIPFIRPVADPVDRGRDPDDELPFDIPHIESSAITAVARRLYALRRARECGPGEGLFSEPAWDILLDLFVTQEEGRRLSVSAVCIGARAPSATALRYLTMLQDAGLVERTRDQTDGRRSHIQLSPYGRQWMVDLLGVFVIG